MKAAVRQQLDPSIRSSNTRDFESSLRAKIVGQAEGVQSLVDMYQVFCAGLNSPGRPVGNLSVSWARRARAKLVSSKPRQRFCLAIRAR